VGFDSRLMGEFVKFGSKLEALTMGAAW
jgi:hypothetical protein